MSLWGGQKLKIRRCLFALLILVTATFFHCEFIPEIFSAPAMVLTALTVAIAMYEKSIPAMLFGVFAGALWDMGSVETDGFFTLMLAATGFIAGSLTTFIIRNSLRANVVLTFFFTAVCNGIYWLLFFLKKGYDGSISVLFKYYLLSAVYTAVFGVVYYCVISYIVKHTKEKKQIK